MKVYGSHRRHFKREVAEGVAYFGDGGLAFVTLAFTLVCSIVTYVMAAMP